MRKRKTFRTITNVTKFAAQYFGSRWDVYPISYLSSLSHSPGAVISWSYLELLSLLLSPILWGIKQFKAIILAVHCLDSKSKTQYSNHALHLFSSEDFAALYPTCEEKRQRYFVQYAPWGFLFFLINKIFPFDSDPFFLFFLFFNIQIFFWNFSVFETKI